MTNNTIILVHPFTSDKILYERITARGYKIITLITDFDHTWIQLCMPTIQKNSDHVLKVSGNAEADLPLIEAIILKNNLVISAVINCFDYSLHYSDALANHFVNTNIDLEFSTIRTNKHQVNESLKKANVRFIKGLMIQNITDLELKSKEIAQFKFPVIIKPASDSVARNDVIIVETIEYLTEKVSRLFKNKSVFHGKPHDGLLIQEYIVGNEFFVNSASLDGKHYTAGVFKYLKEEKKFIGVFSLDEQDREIADILVSYNSECLNALRVSYGLTHNEYIVDKQGSPYLIEINNRVAGIEIPKLSMTCYGSDEISAFLDAIEGQVVHEFDFRHRHAYGAILYLSNFFNKTAIALALSEVHSDNEVVTFRAGIVDPDLHPDDLFIKVSAALLMSNKNKTELHKDREHLLLKERAGTLFI